MRGSKAGLLMAALAMSSAAAPGLSFALQRRDISDMREGPITPGTVNIGRRAEKASAALEKAEAKRARKAAKRSKDAAYNVELTGAARLYRAASSDRRERG